MAFLFMPLPRAATSTNYSTNFLLNTSLHATSCTAITLWASSHDLRPSARSHLSDPLSINNLLCLSPNKLGMDIYFINQITSAPLTSNNIICDNTLMCRSNFLSSRMGWRLKRPRVREATILSLFQPPGVYKQANFSQIIQYRPCSCLDNISPSLHLCLLHAILDLLFPVLKTLFPEVLFPEVETLPSTAPSVSSQHFGCRHLHRNIFLPLSLYHWYLPWDCYLYRTPTHCANSRGILILAVGLLPISHAHSLCPIKRHTDTCHGIATCIARLLLVPTQEAYWYLTWDCYLSHAHSLCPLKRHTDTCHGIAAHISHPLVAPTQEAYWYLPWYCYRSFLQAHSMPHSGDTAVSCIDFLSNFHSCSHC